MLEENHLPVQRTARYYTIGELSDQTKNIWFCLHGFGQLAQYFGRKFTDLADDGTVIVVPEGLSRLYLNNDYKRVGASWLTREDWDHEITDFIGYLNALYDKILDRRDAEHVHITILGFSQGAATACRWLNDNHVQANRLILWAGYFPQGVSGMIRPDKLTATETHYVYGTADEYIREIPDIDSYLDHLKMELPRLKITAFDGGHRVEPAVLKRLVLTTQLIP